MMTLEQAWELIKHDSMPMDHAVAAIQLDARADLLEKLADIHKRPLMHDYSRLRGLLDESIAVLETMSDSASAAAIVSRYTALLNGLPTKR